MARARSEASHSGAASDVGDYEGEHYQCRDREGGCGILHHYGGLHRSIAQIVVKLFEDVSDADVLVATSSLIEGVNTSAENVILWDNKSGVPKLNSFTCRNIAGRAGRMFRHFVGNVYNLEQPPSIYEQTYLDI